MDYPKTSFSVGTLGETLPLIDEFLNPNSGDWDWSESILYFYPELKEQLKGVEKIESRRKIQKSFFTNFYQNNYTKLVKITNEIHTEWEKIDNPIMKSLSNVMEIPWPKGMKIEAKITVNPICPRFIKERSFHLFYGREVNYILEVAIHEVSHFLYFEKWKAVFPEYREEEFDSPHLVWHLSEMVPQIILNDKRIQKVFKADFKSYDEYQNFNIKGKPLLSYISNFYDNRKSFEDFLINSWNLCKENEKTILSI